MWLCVAGRVLLNPGDRIVEDVLPAGFSDGEVGAVGVVLEFDDPGFVAVGVLFHD